MSDEPIIPEIPPPAFQSLDRRVVSYWRARAFIGTFVLLVPLLIASTVLLLNNPALLPWVGGGFSLVLAYRLLLLTWYPARNYRAWGYQIDQKVLVSKQGIWFRTVTLLPLSRLQHVDLNRGPLERSFGLASLILFTAGTQYASIVIPGLDADEAARLRDQLVAAGGDDAV